MTEGRVLDKPGHAVDAGAELLAGAAASGGPAELPQVLNVRELAKLLRIGRNEAYAAVNRGEIPGVRAIGRSIRIDRDTVLSWLQTGQGRVSRSRNSR